MKNLKLSDNDKLDYTCSFLNSIKFIIINNVSIYLYLYNKI